MGKNQFARVQAYSTGKVAGILDEATRVEEASGHVANPKPPIWLVGSREDVERDLGQYMASGATVRLKNGGTATRKKRLDHRCLTAGVLSAPIEMSEIRDATRRNNFREPAEWTRVQRWKNDAIEFLKKQYGDRLSGALLHTDESHPHIHFFVTGDAQRLHPGLRAELVDDRRIDDPAERMAAHKSGLRGWLDDYQADVGARHGHVRGDGSSRPAWRIVDRRVRLELFELDKRVTALDVSISALGDARSAAESDELGRVQAEKSAVLDLRARLFDAAHKAPRHSMRF